MGFYSTFFDQVSTPAPKTERNINPMGNQIKNIETPINN
jgi:hypothetical protein